MTKTRLAFCAVITALGIALSLSATASAAPQLKIGIYDCMAYNYSTAMLDYKGSVKLKSKTAYEHGFGRKKRKIEDKTVGTYKRKAGSIIVFKKGALNKTKAKVEKGDTPKMKPFFNLLYKGEPSGISCYFVEKP